MIRICIGLLVLVAVVNCSPLEQKRPTVVDVPADIFAEKSESVEKVKEPVVEKVDAGSVEELPAKKPSIFDSSASLEDADLPDRPTDFFGFKLPPLFVYRRPIIRDPFFSSYPSFQTFSRPQQPVESSLSSPSSFNMMTHMEKMMERMQSQMSNLWGALLNPTPSFNSRPFRPFLNFGDDSDNDTTSVSFDNLPANYKNSTSETKVIDGQLVTVNKTVHKISGNNSSGFFQVQFVNIRPQGPFKSRTTTETPIVSEAAPTRNDEEIVPTDDVVQTTVPAPAEDPSLNEVDAVEKVDNKTDDKEEKGKIENEDISAPYRYESSDEVGKEISPDVEFEIVPFENLKNRRPSRMQRMPADLSSDLRVNKYAEAKMAKTGALRILDNDVELLDV